MDIPVNMRDILQIDKIVRFRNEFKTELKI